MVEFVTLSDAAKIVADGHTLAIGGMTLYRRPVAFAAALLHRKPRPRDLTLLAFTAGYECDLLLGAGCVSAIRTCYFGLETFGLAPMFTRMAGEGSIIVIEETEASIVMGLRARMSGVSYMPSTAWIGTDLPALRPDVKSIDDPYTGEPLTAFPAIPVDVTVLHGLEADRSGNVRLNQNLAIDMELVYVAHTVIVTVERIVDRIVPSQDGPLLPAPGADYIVEAPRGAWPTSCHPHYPVGGGELLRYIDACNANRFNDYIEALRR